MNNFRPLFLIVIFFILGIVLQNYFPVPSVFLLTLNGMVFFCCGIFLGRKMLGPPLLFLFFLTVGWSYAQVYQILPPQHISRVARYYAGKPVALEGVIVSDVEPRNFLGREKVSFVLEVKRLETPWGWRKKSGRVLVNVFRKVDLFYGDYVWVKGKLHRPFDFASATRFSYKEYLQQRQIELILSVKKNGPIEKLSSGHGSPFRIWPSRLREKFKMVFRRHLSSQEADVMQAILLGCRSNIPSHLQELFARTGTAHILAISGLHVGIVTALILLLLKLLPVKRKIQYVVTIILLIGYVFITGARPSVVRATIMSIVFLLSFLVERETEPLNTLALTAFILLIINPLNLFDIGFQLSFLSVLSILCFYPLLIELFPGGPGGQPPLRFKFLRQSFAVSLSAWLGVAGLIAYYFHLVTPVTILANLVVVPLTSAVVALGFGLMLVAPILSFCSFVFAYSIKLVLNVMVMAILLFDKIPGSCFYVKDLSLWQVTSYYVVLTGIFYIWKVLKLTK